MGRAYALINPESFSNGNKLFSANKTPRWISDVKCGQSTFLPVHERLTNNPSTRAFGRTAPNPYHHEHCWAGRVYWSYYHIFTSRPKCHPDTTPPIQNRTRPPAGQRVGRGTLRAYQEPTLQHNVHASTYSWWCFGFSLMGILIEER